MEQNKSSAKRIQWLDICRGILIILMVTGHSTGLFNKYIYQFHMAAFFFLSGYMSQPEKRGMFQTLFDKFFTVLLPAVTTVLFGLVLLWLLHLGGWDTLVSSWEFPGWRHALDSLFLQGDIWVDVLGANWFLITLFGVCIVNKLIHQLTRKSSMWYITVSLVLYAAGYAAVKTGSIPKIGMFSMDQVLIGNLFYAIGHCFLKHHILERITQAKRVWSFALLIISAGCLWFVRQYLHIVIDWASRTFAHPILDGLTALNGTFFVFAVSLLISRFMKRTGKLLCHIGKNTLGILFFHFTFFKVLYLPFYWGGIIDKTDFSCITPGNMSTQELAVKYWYVIAAGAVVLSLGMWKLLMQSRKLRFLLGQDKQTYMELWNSHAVMAIRKFNQKITDNCKKWYQRFSEEKSGNRLLCYAVILEFALLCALIIRQGIILNDDLNTSLIREQGYIPLLVNALKNELRMGRPLRLVGGFNYSLAFLTTNVTFNRLIQCIFLGVCLIQFARLIRNLFRSNKIATVTVVLIITCMPLTFEHSAPNAFITLVILPLWHLCISLNNWVSYLRTGEKKYFWWYLIAWIVALQGYEFVVTYTPAFLLIYIYEKKLKINTLREAIYKCLPPAVSGAVYIVATFALGKLVPSHYTGTALTFVSVGSSFEIIKTLALSAIPGYFLFNSKYVYLFYLYSGEYARNIYGAAASKNVGWFITDSAFLNELGRLARSIWLSPANILRISALAATLFYLWRFSQITRDEHNSVAEFRLGVFLCLLGYTLIPSLPNSLSALYQGNVNAVSFTSLPVSMFLFFTVCLSAGYLISAIWEKWRKSVLICCIFIGLLGFSVQTMNIVFADKSEQNFKRISEIENLFQSNCMHNLDGETVYAPDLFETRDALAVSEPYWGEIADHNQIDLDFTEDENAAVKIFYINDEYFCVVTEEEIAVLSPKVLNGRFLIAMDTDSYEVTRSDSWQYDGEFFCYRFENSESGPIPLDNSTPAFNNYQPHVGDTLDTAEVDGMYEDGWCGSDVRVRIDSGEDGLLHITGWFSEEIDPEKGYAISVYCDEKLAQIYPLQEQVIDITLNLQPNTVTTVNLRSNFVLEKQKGDVRELSFILTDMY